MKVFKIYFFILFLSFMYSCSPNNQVDNNAPNTSKDRRLFKIKRVEKVEKKKEFIYFDMEDTPFFRVTVVYTGDYAMNLYYHTRLPSIKFSNVPKVLFFNYEHHRLDSNGEYFFEHDTSLILNKNEELTLLIPLGYSRESRFLEYDYVCVEFWLLISAPHDLSYYFDPTPKTVYYRSRKSDDGTITYDYPLEFTYWIPNRMFFEHHLLDR
jgi:hypothetical protein